MAEEIVIHEGNYQQFVNVDPHVHGRGLIPRDFTKNPHGSMPFAAPFDIPAFSNEELMARAKDLEDKKARLSDMIRAANMPALDQNGTNFCWANGPTNCVRVVRELNHLPFVDLSPASVACPIKGFRNEGGWGGEALEYIVEHGVAPAKLWPPNAISKQYWTEEEKKEALNYRVTEWYDLKPRNMPQLLTCLILGIPVAVGFSWWSHEVMAVDMVDMTTIRIWNSWGSTWSDGGFGLLKGNQAVPDDQVAPRVVVAQA